jgi:hypothetical protein
MFQKVAILEHPSSSPYNFWGRKFFFPNTLFPEKKNFPEKRELKKKLSKINFLKRQNLRTFQSYNVMTLGLDF